MFLRLMVFFFQAEDGIRYLVRSRGLGDVYKRQFGNCLQFAPGKDGIVLGEIDFPSLGHVWLAQQQRGARVSFACAEGSQDIELADYEKLIDASTRLVSVSHVSYLSLIHISEPTRPY